MNNRSVFVICALVILWIVWGSNAWATKIAIATIPPLMMSGICFLIAGLVFLGWSFFRRGWKQILDLEDWKTGLIIGVIMLLGGQGARAWGEQYLSSGTTSLLFATVPLWVIIVGRIFFKKRTGKKTMLWTGVGLVGIVLLFLPLIENGIPSFRGGLSLIAGAFLWAVGSLYMGSTHRSLVSTISSMSKQMLVGGILLTVSGIVIGEFSSLDLSKISFQSFMGMMYMITIGSLIGFPIFIWLLQKTSEFVANSFSFVSPLIAIIIGRILLNESFGTQIIVAAIILLGSVTMIMASEWKGKGYLRRSDGKHFLGG